jgi:3-hydroxyisobutyrate dehydrogenase-like beta-hydroxyacid dehydrogenase
MKVGFIGLGRMGSAIAGNVAKGGHDLVVYNRSPEKAAPFADQGARVAASIAEVCAEREVVITMVAHDAALESDALAAGGIVASLPQGAIHLAMGTHGVDVMRTLGAAHGEAGQILVAAPVLGRPDVAAAGQLGLVPAGPADAVARCQPLFDVIGRRTFDGGTDPESAASIKIANNFVLGCAIEAMGEAFALVRKYGVDADVFLDVMTDGLFAAPAYAVYGKIIADEAYDPPGQSAVLGLKDANLALVAAEAKGVPLPSCNVWRDRLIGAIAHGEGGLDWAVMARDQARASGIE